MTLIAPHPIFSELISSETLTDARSTAIVCSVDGPPTTSCVRASMQFSSEVCEVQEGKDAVSRTDERHARRPFQGSEKDQCNVEEFFGGSHHQHECANQWIRGAVNDHCTHQKDQDTPVPDEK